MRRLLPLLLLLGAAPPPVAPALEFQPIAAGHGGVGPWVYRGGEPRLLNLFGSWCGPCAAEVGQLLRLKRAGLPIDGIAVRDSRAGVARFLARHGDPYARIGGDPAGVAERAFRASGVPESYLIDGRGRIVWHVARDLGPADVAAILAAARRAR